MATAGHSVVFSGLTVAIGLLALVVLPVPFLHSMGYGGVLIPVVSVAVALTLLPVCLAGLSDARGGTALGTVLPAIETGAPGGTAVIDRVRRTVAGNPAVAGISGSGPETVDFDHAIYDRFPLMLALVTALTFLVLARAFRSLLLALKAEVLNLASLAAAYGVLVFVWQDGHGSNLIFGLPATGAITNWVAIVVFAFLFGLAIDYEVFILSRMREAWDATHDTSTAVIEGIGRLVTSAALILTLAFVSMSTAPLTFLKVLATGLAAGILVDALVVRSLLVPALVSLFGRWNRWLPTPVAKLLRVEVQDHQ